MLLKEESFIVLSIIDKCEDVDVVKNIVKEIEDSTASVHKQIYEECLKFHADQGRFPDFGYLIKNFPDISFGAKYTGEYSSDIIVKFLTELRKENARNKAQEFLLKDDFNEAAKACGYALNIDKDIPIYTSNDALVEYDSMKGRESGIFSGISQVDNIVNSFAYGTLTVIAAPPSSFKTTMAQNIAYYSLHKGFRSLFISLELQKRNIFNNLLSRHSAYMGTPFYSEYANKRMLEKYGQYDRFVEAKEDFEKRDFDKLITVLAAEDIVSFEKPYLYRLIEQVHDRMGGLDAIFLDYIQLCRGFTPQKTDSTEFVNNLIMNISLLSKSFKGKGLISFILSQINREGMKTLEKTEGEKGMSLSSLAEFNSLERESHVVLMLYANDADKRGRALKLKIAKNRSGLTHNEYETVLIDPATGVIGKHKFNEVINTSAMISTFSSNVNLEDSIDDSESIF